MATEIVPQDTASVTAGPVDNRQETSYLYVKVLGRGAFGEAVLYRKTEDNSLVVWKEVNLGRLGDKERRDSMNEVDILSLLNHTNVITYYNHFLDQDTDTLFIEMEYASGGTLYTKIANQTQLFPETQVLWYLYQLASALDHIHSYGIIHRDIKTMNVFMTKSDLLKLGDFGISKVLESKEQRAESIVGTPYYMSPEIVQGECYDHKTDIWALGCVLFELLTLTKTFQATNQLRLAYEIVKGEIKGEIDPKYSSEINNLVNHMLKKDPKERPTTQDILGHSVLIKDQIDEEMEKKVWELNSGVRKLRIQSASSIETVPVVKSKVSEVYQWGGGKLTPQKQGIFAKGVSAVQVAAGHGHFAVVTMEKELYTWANVQGGMEIVGQLGQGNKSAYKAPKKVEALEGIGIIQASCGEDFTLCLTDDGNVYAMGSDYYGCLGCDNSEGDEVLTPIPVDFFRSMTVDEISCGQNHVVALTKDREVYTWGCGEFGRLGLGSEDDFMIPQKVKTPGKHFIRHACAGSDGTFLITSGGRLLACGSNEHNKLGFNSETSGLRKRKQRVYDIPCKYTFSTVKPLVRYNIMSVSTGGNHSAAVDLYGHLYTFGSNKYGQLGLGDFKRKIGICKVGGVLTGKTVGIVTCGDTFTVVSTNDNQVYAWGNGENGRLGSDFKDQGKGPNSQSTAVPRPIFGSLHHVSNLSASHWHTIVIAEKVLNQKTLKSRVSSPKLFVPTSPAVQEEDSAFSDVHQNWDSHQLTMYDSGKPASPELSEFRSVVVDQACSPIVQDTNRPGSGGRPGSAGAGRNEESKVPDWLLAELDEAEVIPIPGKLQPVSSSHVDPDQPGGPRVYADYEEMIDEEKSLSKGKQKDSGEDKDKIIAQLTHKVSLLEAVNTELKQVIYSQEQIIKSLQEK